MAKKIQILSHKPPYPKADGGAIVISQLLETLIIDNNVTFLTIITDKHPSLNEINHPNLIYKSVYVDTKTRLFNLTKNLFHTKSYIISRFESNEYENALKLILENESFDLIIFESLFTSPYIKIIKKLSSAKLIYRAHNIEYQIWEKKSISKSNNPLINHYLKLQAARLKVEELKFLDLIDRIACISFEDQKVISKISNAQTILLGMFVKNIPEKINNSSDIIDFFHLGAMDWKPNQEAINWFIDNVWPTIHEINPKSYFHIAGKGMSKSFHAKTLNGLVNHGEVENAKYFISKHKIMLVPLFIGSGLRVKIIEGLSMGKCIITTNIGLQGIQCKHMENILIANSVEDFINTMQFCLDNPEKVKQIENEARNFALKNFSKEKFFNQIEKIF